MGLFWFGLVFCLENGHTLSMSKAVILGISVYKVTPIQPKKADDPDFGVI